MHLFYHLGLGLFNLIQLKIHFKKLTCVKKTLGLGIFYLKLHDFHRAMWFKYRQGKNHLAQFFFYQANFFSSELIFFLPNAGYFSPLPISFLTIKNKQTKTKNRPATAWKWRLQNVELQVLYWSNWLWKWKEVFRAHTETQAPAKLQVPGKDSVSARQKGVHLADNLHGWQIEL